jgi:L-lactate dehydrogenase
MDKLIDFGTAFMTKRGVPEERARYVAQVVVEAEAFRQTTHGLAQFSVINDSLAEKVDPDREPRVVSRRGATALIDGDRCIGNLAMKAAKDLATEMARANGIGFVGVRNTQWIGALGTHLISTARKGLVCQAWAQTNTCKDCAPFGGIDARFSTNPIALAFPTDGDPVVADFSTATMSMGGAHALIRAGEKTDVPRFLDNEGNPTDDPKVIEDEGSLMFMGCEVDGHKGYALSLFNEALTVLSGGSANNPEAASYQSFALMALDPEAFCGREYYEKEMQRFLAHVRTSRSRSGTSSIRLPGERGFAALADCRANGVPLDDAKMARLREIAEANGVDPV